ncbi:MAG: exonuclease domain-containing protein [Acetivibrio ethanolgignens]
MDYIIIDLEWNQCPLGRDLGERDLPFEIIEIGAVKLDENRQFKGKFHSLIKPQVYKDIHQKTWEIIHIDKEELEQGEAFETVIRDFFAWCGEEYRFGTWGPMDLIELQRNMEHFGITEVFQKPFFYCDIQKLFSLETEGHKNPHTLEYAVDYYEFAQKEEFHRALADAEYTARVFQEISERIVKRYFSIDYYHNPKTKEDEVYVDYGTYTKLISKEYDSREAALRDKRIQRLECHQCGKLIRKRINWFSNSMKKNYYCIGYCAEHGYMKGRIRVHKTRDGHYFVVKIVSQTSKEGAKEIQERYRELKKKQQV